MKNPDIFAHNMCMSRECYLVYAIKAGSHLYGTTTPESDEDYRGVFVPGIRYMLGLQSVEAISETSERIDIMMHEVRKFVTLCLNGNPNILDWIFAPEDCHIFVSNHFDPLLENRDLLLSRRIVPRFGGYVTGHLSRMERGVTGHLGEKRKADIERHGYSTKNAMHLIRLARMGCEAVETGKYNVRRPDVEELLSIKRGEWDVERIREEGERLVARMDAAVETSPLPEEPPEDRVEQLVIGVLMARLKTMKARRNE